MQHSFAHAYLLLKPHVGTEAFYGSFETNMQKIVGNKQSPRSLLKARHSAPMQLQFGDFMKLKLKSPSMSEKRSVLPRNVYCSCNVQKLQPPTKFSFLTQKLQNIDPII